MSFLLSLQAMIFALFVIAMPVGDAHARPTFDALITNDASSPVPVTVENFPATQEVSGTVGVNDPTAQEPFFGNNRAISWTRDDGCQSSN